ncbi:hypothetical protein SAMN05660776_1571 [Salegentibacter holothuriorum]|uniref:Lipoprotein n=1 Tax=Salegentibacter holothuriorum TaxID=241145 RepID=A0A1T5BXS1_9FLAO|nr:hypothetical protein [Salegentibacter holothuriorum]SKB51793.1 hypothetical protein SAMN05660776_1571 [Salegentibacter holothuriorum]
MKNKILVFILFVIVIGCKNQEDLLIQEEWILFSRINFNQENYSSDTLFFNKNDRVLSLRFAKDGKLRVRENDQMPKGVYFWSEGMYENEIVLDETEAYPYYEILELNSKTLKWREFASPYSKEKIIDTYKHPDDPIWNESKGEATKYIIKGF